MPEEDKLAQWAATFPELSTRPILLSELETNVLLRNTLFCFFGDMAVLSKLKDPCSTLRLIDICYKYYRMRFAKFQLELDSRDNNIYGQLVSVYRNYYTNIMRRVKPDTRFSLATDTNPHFVKREWGKTE